MRILLRSNLNLWYGGTLSAHRAKRGLKLVGWKDGKLVPSTLTVTSTSVAHDEWCVFYFRIHPHCHALDTFTCSAETLLHAPGEGPLPAMAFTIGDYLTTIVPHDTLSASWKPSFKKIQHIGYVKDLKQSLILETDCNNLFVNRFLVWTKLSNEAAAEAAASEIPPVDAGVDASISAAA